jgi:hypothetical protein
VENAENITQEVFLSKDIIQAESFDKKFEILKNSLHKEETNNIIDPQRNEEKIPEPEVDNKPSDMLNILMIF